MTRIAREAASIGDDTAALVASLDDDSAFSEEGTTEDDIDAQEVAEGDSESPEDPIGALIEASHDLYANRWVTLRRVILPLAWPGLMAGAILVFVPCLGAVLEPILLGGGKQLLMGNLIQTQFGGARNWPFGAAIAVVLMGLVMIVLMARALRDGGRHDAA